ncbi:MAG: GDP-mannose 4,6-dehydratase [Victivallaceae bacterium]|nr:GDP-mannose 4,6-dehydratase [Victivallaceae bacterium]
MKYLITGHSGFVGKYLIRHILRMEPDAEIAGLDLVPAGQKPAQLQEFQIDLLETEKLNRIVAAFAPDYIVHLASFSSVAYSWRRPLESFRNNTNIFLNLLEAIHKNALPCRLLSIGSSEEYGAVSAAELPLTENLKPRPLSPYAVARVAQENMSWVYSKGFGLDIVCTRSFNHIGCGQDDRFVVSSLARRFAEFKAGKCPEIIVGDTGIVRDFLDVRDVVRAYYLLLKSAAGSGEIFNICSGRQTSIQDIIEIFKEITATAPPLTVDPDLLRPVENRIVTGSNRKLYELTGWQPEIKLEDSLRDIAQWWEKHLSYQ